MTRSQILDDVFQIIIFSSFSSVQGTHMFKMEFLVPEELYVNLFISFDVEKFTNKFIFSRLFVFQILFSLVYHHGRKEKFKDINDFGNNYCQENCCTAKKFQTTYCQVSVSFNRYFFYVCYNLCLS